MLNVEQAYLWDGKLFSDFNRGVVNGETYRYDAAFLLHCISCMTNIHFRLMPLHAP